jgi:HEPN domain-containing protein
LKNLELAEQWHQISQDDFEMSQFALQKGKLLHAAFCAQQAIEKSIKGLHVLHGLGQPPYTHDLVRLAESISEVQKFDPAVLAVFSAQNPFYIRERYPDYKRMLKETLDEETVVEFQQCAEGVLKCLQDSASEQMKKSSK